MAPPLSSLYTLSFVLAALTTLLVAATLRLIAILPNNTRSKTQPWRKPPLATRVLIVLGSGGHTHEMFHLLRELDTAKYTHRTYVVSSGDAFSAQRAVDFERGLETRAKQGNTAQPTSATTAAVAPTGIAINVTDPTGATTKSHATIPTATTTTSRARAGSIRQPRVPCFGPAHYDMAVVPRARNIHQSLLTTPFSCLYTFYSCFAPLLPKKAPITTPTTPTPNEATAAADIPDLIIANGPATAVMVVVASLVLRFFDIRGANTRGKCRTLYVESFARVSTLSLSGRVLVRIVDRFLVQWEALEGVGGRAEFWGVLV